MEKEHIIWRAGKFKTFGMQGREVNGLQAIINGLRWQITKVRNDKTPHGPTVKENFYLTNEKRNHLSFHKDIHQAQQKAESFCKSQKK